MSLSKTICRHRILLFKSTNRPTGLLILPREQRQLVAIQGSSSTVTMFSTLEQNMRATTESFLYSFNGQWKPNITLELRTPECMFKTLPSNLGHPPRNNEEWAVAFGKVAHIVKDGHVSTFHETDDISAWAWR